MRIVLALGGNALLQRNQPLGAKEQRENVKQACAAIAKIASEHQVIITHGNGPQIGLLALQTLAYQETEPYPLDILGAESQGMIGYLLAQGLRNCIPAVDVVALLTQVEVDANDPAFQKPTKFIGPVYQEEQAKRIAAQHGWQIAQDGDYFRRVVPSPLPRRIVEASTIEFLVNAKKLVICTGGGGVPVVRDSSGCRGVEAVIDKDLASALLAKMLKADRLLLLTDVPSVVENWGTPQAKPIGKIHAADLKQFKLAAGSMAPKAKAACEFVEATGAIAQIGALNDVVSILADRVGTTVIA